MLTDDWGCVSSTNAYIPKDPNAFMWIFPSGCYDFCPQALPLLLLNPFGSFTNWEWLHNGISTSSGSGNVQPLWMISGGDYFLTLQNDICATTSDFMKVSLVNPNCGGAPPCGSQSVSGVGVSSQSNGTDCEWYANIIFNSVYGTTVPYTLTSSDGWISPSAGAMPAGTSSAIFHLMLPAGFSNAWVSLFFTYDLGNGQYCSEEVRLWIGDCQQQHVAAEKGGRTNGEGSTPGRITETAQQQPLLSLAPNPASQMVQIGYRVTASSTIEIYDVLGRQVAAKALPAGTDSWNVDVSAFAAGIYQVILRSNEGKTLLHKALSIQR